MWANTVLANGTIWGIIIYTGKESRSVMNSSRASAKFGLVDNELNRLSKILFLMLLLMSLVNLLLHGVSSWWWIYFLKYVLLLTSIIPISLRVNLDIAKAMYSFFWIARDKLIPGTIPRSSTIPEELGRI